MSFLLSISPSKIGWRVGWQFVWCGHQWLRISQVRVISTSTGIPISKLGWRLAGFLGLFQLRIREVRQVGGVCSTIQHFQEELIDAFFNFIDILIVKDRNLWWHQLAAGPAQSFLQGRSYRTMRLLTGWFPAIVCPIVRRLAKYWRTKRPSHFLQVFLERSTQPVLQWFPECLQPMSLSWHTLWCSTYSSITSRVVPLISVTMALSSRSRLL